MTDRFEADAGDLTPILQDATFTGIKVIGLRVSIYLIGFVASILIARALGPEGRGLYALPLVIVGIAVTLAHVGLEQANVHLASRAVRLSKLWANSSLVAIGMGVLGWLVIGLIYLGSSGEAFGGLPATWIILSVALVPLLLQNLYWSNLLQISGRLMTVTRATLAGVLLHAVAVVVLFALGVLTPFRVLALMWLVNGATWALLAKAGSETGLFGVTLALPELRRGIAFGLKAYVGSIFVFLLLRVDQFLVERELGFEALGLYSLAVALAELLWLISDPLAAALLPHQVRAGRGDDRRLGDAMARLNLGLALLAGTMMWILAPYIVRYLYGSEFAGAVWPLRLLVPGIVALAAQRPLAAVLLKEGRAVFVSVVSLVALVANVVANLLLLPRIGVIGASISSSVAYFALAAAYVAATRRDGESRWGDLLPRGVDLHRLVQPRPSGPVLGEPLRIVMVIGQLERGGTEGQVSRLSAELVQRGHRVTIVCLSHAGAHGPSTEQAGVEVVQAGFRGLTPILNPLPLLRTFGRIYRLIRERDPHIVHCYLYWSELIGAPMGRLVGARVVSTRRALYSARGRRRALRPIELLADRLSHAVICNSEAVRRDAVKIGRVHQAETRVVYNGVDVPDDWSPARTDSPVEILTIANLIAYKGHHYLLEALSEVQKDMGAEAPHLSLAGTGPEEDQLRHQARALGIAGDVRFLGAVSDVRPLLDRCTFTVLPSLSEGFPNAVLESLANGRAVIASDVGGVPEILERGGILLPPADPRALARAIKELARDPGRARRLGIEGREHVTRRFGIERMVNETLGVYAEVLGASREAMI